ncbi:MAG: PQQ-binding-like beta-propeller repeat protein, partial [Elusimicrobia bacterium]|nr:PQQ-binding-like beta-propeller repeat protein [Elusimicrobiota bacterium]
MAQTARDKNTIHVAVLEFSYPKGELSSGSSIVQEKLTTHIAKEQDIEVVERNLLKKLLDEKRLELLGIVSASEQNDLGTFLGVQAILTGTLNDLSDKETEINARLIDTASGRILRAESAEISRTWKDAPAPHQEQPPAKRYPDADEDKDISAKDPRTKWIFKTLNVIYTVPAFSKDGTIYIPSSDSFLYALNQDGHEKWRFKTGDEVRTSPAVSPDGTIYIGSYDGNVYALDSNGRLKWQFSAGAKIDSSPALSSDGTIYIGDWNGILHALNPDGTQRWAFNANGLIRSSPVLDRYGDIYCATAQGVLFSVSPHGRLNWSRPLGGDVYSSPMAGPSRRIYMAAGNALYAFSQNGDKLWVFYTSQPIYAPPSIAFDGTIYIGSWDNNLYALTPNGAK